MTDPLIIRTLPLPTRQIPNADNRRIGRPSIRFASIVFRSGMLHVRESIPTE